MSNILLLNKPRSVYRQVLSPRGVCFDIKIKENIYYFFLLYCAKRRSSILCRRHTVFQRQYVYEIKQLLDFISFFFFLEWMQNEHEQFSVVTVRSNDIGVITLTKQ